VLLLGPLSHARCCEQQVDIRTLPATPGVATEMTSLLVDRDRNVADAVAKLQKLSRSDATELRKMTNASVPVKNGLMCATLALGVKPWWTPTGIGNHGYWDYWAPTMVCEWFIQSCRELSGRSCQQSSLLVPNKFPPSPVGICRQERSYQSMH